MSLPILKFKVHVQNKGWMGEYEGGETGGTAGESLRLEAMTIEIDSDLDLGVRYCGHVENIGWQDWVADGAICGTTDQGLRLEAVKIELTGSDASKYNIYYRGHVQNIGYMAFVKNGAEAGTNGGGLRMEAITIRLVPSNVTMEIDNASAFFKKETVAPSVATNSGLLVNEQGVDVSYWQGTGINWNSVKSDGKTFAIPRALESNDSDSTFVGNVSGIRSAGLKLGTYQFARATSASAAQVEAQSMLNRLAEVGGSFDAGVWYDLEISSIAPFANEIIDAWCTVINNAGYKAGFYTYYSWMNSYVSDAIKAKYPNYWGAHYASSTDMNPHIWQFTSQGTVNGISGYCDVNQVMR